MPSELRKATIQAAVLNVTSSVLAQLLRMYRTGVAPSAASTSSLNPLGLNPAPILQFLVFCLLSTPPNYLWQAYLERRFPGYPSDADKQKVKVDDDGKVGSLMPFFIVVASHFYWVLCISITATICGITIHSLPARLVQTSA